jgi:glutathione synthase
MRILLLVGSPGDLDISHALYANNLVGLGHDVRLGVVNSISAHGSRLRCLSGPVVAPLEPYGAYPGQLTVADIDDIDLVWVLNQPHPGISADVWQLLWRLNLQVPFVNDVTGLLMLNNKNNLPLVVPSEHLPETWTANTYAELWEAYRQNSQGRWLVKPPNSGAGADVFVLEPYSTNNRALLQSMTGNDTAAGSITRGGLEGLRNRYCVLQEFVEHREEKRVALAGGRPVRSQVKRISTADHRGNITQSADFSICALDDDERDLASRVGEALLRHGIRFAGIDVAYPYVFEVNLVNPGGLVEPVQLGLADDSREVIAEIVASVPELAGCSR